MLLQARCAHIHERLLLLKQSASAVTGTATLSVDSYLSVHSRIFLCGAAIVETKMSVLT